MNLKNLGKFLNAVVFRRCQRNMGGLTERPMQRDHKYHQKYIRVAILGADTTAGEMTAFLLKQNPIVSQLYLQADDETRGLAADFRWIDTRCKVKSYSGDKGIPDAVRRADVVVIIGLDKCPPTATIEFRLRTEADRLVRIVEECTKYCPKSVIVVSVQPVSCTVPLVAEIFRKTDWYHPGRIIGSSALVQLRVNTFTARYLDLDPISVHVPLIGGPDMDCVVPLFSRASPINVPIEDAEMLYDKIADVDKINPIETPKKCNIISAPMSEAYGLNQIVTTIGIGMCGDERANGSAYIRQNIIPTCEHLVTTVRFGPMGVFHNYGVPKMNRQELRRFEKIILVLQQRECMAKKLYQQLCKQQEKVSKPTVIQMRE